MVFSHKTEHLFAKSIDNRINVRYNTNTVKHTFAFEIDKGGMKTMKKRAVDMKNKTGRRRTSSRSRRQESARLFKKMIFGVSCLVMTAGIFGTYHMMHSDMVMVYADEHLSDLQYKIVEIKEGDSLWSIAKENMNPGFHDVNEYIEEVKTCNQLSSDKLYAGSYLMVPYYEIIEE